MTGAGATDADLVAIVAAMAEGASMSSILEAVDAKVGERTVRRRVAALVESGRLLREGDRRWARYRVPASSIVEDRGGVTEKDWLSSESRTLLDRVSLPLGERPVARFRAQYLDAHVPGRTAWLSAVQRKRSCNHRAGHIRLNTELVKKPKELLEHVVLHEMAHLLEPDHRERFVALLDRHRPSWREARAELKELPLRSGDRADAPLG